MREVVLMAKELRHETLFVAGQGGSANAIAEFRNDSSDMIHIRKNTLKALQTGVTPGDEGVLEISKSPAMASQTNNNVFFVQTLELDGQPTGATPADGSRAGKDRDAWARGQLTLEPGESLYMNWLRTTGGQSSDLSSHISYEF